MMCVCSIICLQCYLSSCSYCWWPFSLHWKRFINMVPCLNHEIPLIIMITFRRWTVRQKWKGGGMMEYWSPHWFLVILENISLLVAFCGSLKIYNAVQEDLSWWEIIGICSMCHLYQCHDFYGCHMDCHDNCPNSWICSIHSPCSCALKVNKSFMFSSSYIIAIITSI